MRKRNITLWALMLLGGLFSTQATAQVNVNMPYNSGLQSFSIAPPGTCQFIFRDNNGTGNYSNNSQHLSSLATFAPSDPSQKRIRAEFTSFATENLFDALYVYDGTTVSLPNIATNINTVIPGQFSSGQAQWFTFRQGGWMGGTGPGTVQASAGNTTGALTFQFDSDGSVNQSGWQANIVEVDAVGTVCSMTASGNQSVSTGTDDCGATVSVTAPSFSPAGCNVGKQLQYSINGGAPVVVDPVPANVTIFFPKGTNVVLWELVDPCGGAVTASASQTIQVDDLTPPSITCPQDIIINLGPGECCQFVSWAEPLVTDNCPFMGPAMTLTQTVPFTNYWTGWTVDLENLSPDNLNISNVEVQASLAGLGAGNYNLRAYLKLGTHVGFENNAGAWTLGGEITANITAGFPAVLLFDIPIDDFEIPVGQTAGLYVVANNGNGTGVRVVAQISTAPSADANLRIDNQPGNWVNGLFGGVAFANENPRPRLAVTYNAAGDGEAEQLSGPVSGTELCKEDSPLTVVYQATDAAGNTSTCSFTITINPYLNAIQSLICNDLVQVSVDASCTAIIGADQVLEGGPYACYDDYIVELDKSAPFGNGPWLPAVIGPNDIGKTYQVRVTDPETGNKCWGNLLVEDKLPPVLDCKAALLYCNSDPTPCATPAIDVPSVTQLPADFVNHGSGTAFTLSGNTLPGGVYFDLTNDSNGPLTVTGFGVRFGNPQFGQVNPPQTVDVFTADTYVDNETDMSAWTDLGPVDIDDIPDYFMAGTGDLAQVPLNATVVIPAGESRGFHIFGRTACPVFNYFNNNGPQVNDPWTMQGGPVSFALLSNLFQAGAQSAPNIQVNWSLVGEPACLPNGLALNVDAFQISNNCYSVNAGAGDPVLEACSVAELCYVDTEINEDCASGLTKTIQRKWTATDASGNSATCIQLIELLRPTIDDIVLPPSYDGIDQDALECGGQYPSPQYIDGIGLQGWPNVFDSNDGCSIGWTYDDAVIEVCDGTYKVRRKWTIIDWCSGDDIEVNQIIKVADHEGPTFDCPANITVSTDPFTCCAQVDLPDFIASDNCSRIASVSAMIITFDPQTNQQTGMYQIGGTLSDFPGNNHWDPDTMVNVGYTPCLPMGNHQVFYTLEDDCGNTSSCSFRVTVRDYTPPVAACDEFTVVGIGVDDPFDCYQPVDDCTFAGVTWLKATTFDDGSYDNCGDIKFTIRRMAPYSDCVLGLNPINGHPECDPQIDPFPDFPSEFERAISEYDSIKFYCCEVGTEQTVILRVYQLDVNGNITVGPDGTPVFNECMITVEVQDKIKPVCQSPGNVTVSCENFDPSLWAYGKAAVYDNCCLDLDQVYQGQCGLSHTVNYSLFDTVCSKGTITRTFRAFDCHGFSSQCTQRIFVNYEQDYWLKLPNDVIVTECDGTGNYGEPEFNGEDCELLGVSFEDEIFTVVPDACFKIERTWTIINWCTYNPNGSCVIIPNPNPNPTVNHPSNLPGPTVSPAGTPSPWNPTNVKVAPSDPSPTNYSTFWDANANCYKYKQIIKVVDGDAPEVQCPASPVEVCDLTPNDPYFWNESYWYDNVTGSHDLCEAPADLCITATDLCSGSNLDIRYLLFLDLDGDGTMETVISSTNLPGYNNVNYGNAQNPNFTGGTARQFDGRPVLPNQKYGFAIETTVDGDNKTACVRWNTQQQQNNYVVPELPYGNHKIKWVIADGCGNETVCEYFIEVKDCKKPTVVCINGLSVNIMPTQMVTLWDTDFLQYTEDNCTPSNMLVTGIRKSGQGTGFPTNPDGSPQTNVTFTCDELGTQLVELWSIDLAGNADYCETYVIVQDNMGNCGMNFGNVAGALKTESDNGLEDANVTLTGNHPALPGGSMFDVTDASGDYALNGIPLLGDFTIMPNKDNDPLNGVSTFDLVLINKHILGLAPLNTAYKMIAADANNSRSITTFDIVELRKLILGIYTELPNNTSWRFVDKAYTFPNTNNPFQEIFPETKQIAAMQASMDDENFVSVKTGDVNGNAVTSSLINADDRTAGTLLFDVEDRGVKSGEVFTVNFKAAEQVMGYQFTMNYNNLELVEVVPGTNMKLDNFGVFASEGALTTSWDGKEQAEFGLTFRAKTAGQLSQMLGVSSRITKAEAYNAGAERLQVAFRFNGLTGSTIAGLGFELYQNTPNPFINKTQIGFYLPEATTATLTIFDESGRTIFTQSGDYSKGYNAVTIDRAVLRTTGVLYYQLETAMNSATKKMIQTK